MSSRRSRVREELPHGLELRSRDGRRYGKDDQRETAAAVRSPSRVTGIGGARAVRAARGRLRSLRRPNIGRSVPKLLARAAPKLGVDEDELGCDRLLGGRVVGIFRQPLHHELPHCDAQFKGVGLDQPNAAPKAAIAVVTLVRPPPDQPAAAAQRRSILFDCASALIPRSGEA